MDESKTRETSRARGDQQGLPVTIREAPSTSREADPGSVLVVDHDLGVGRSLARALAGEFQVSIIAEAAQALRVVDGPYPPDLLLLNWKLTDADGLEVCLAIKARLETRDIPVIFFADQPNEFAEARAFALGASDYVSEHTSRPVLRARVRAQVQRKRELCTLRQLCGTDPLTGAASRRRANQWLETEWRSCRRNREPLSLVLLDLDRFRRFNDLRGYAAGDACLQRTAAVLLAGLRRPHDLLARYSGDEFLVILPGTHATGAAALADRLRRSVESLRMSHPASDDSPFVTVSGGVATSNPQSAARGPRSLLDSAERALGEAQRRGRNRTVVQPGVELWDADEETDVTGTRRLPYTSRSQELGTGDYSEATPWQGRHQVGGAHGRG